MNLDHEEEVRTRRSQADATGETGGVGPSGQPPLPTPDEIVREAPRKSDLANRYMTRGP